MQSNIFVTRKLEEKIKGAICEEANVVKNDFIGDWSAFLFSISHKKCWLLLNKETKYIFILANIKKADLPDITAIFKQELYEQLKYDNINVKLDFVERIVGDVKLRHTDNDKKAIGTLNSYAYYFEDWKYQYKKFENMPFRDLCGRINSLPSDKLNWKLPKDKMKEVIEQINF